MIGFNGSNFLDQRTKGLIDAVNSDLSEVSEDVSEIIDDISDLQSVLPEIIDIGSKITTTGFQFIFYNAISVRFTNSTEIILTDFLGYTDISAQIIGNLLYISGWVKWNGAMTQIYCQTNDTSDAAYGICTIAHSLFDLALPTVSHSGVNDWEAVGSLYVNAYRANTTRRGMTVPVTLKLVSSGSSISVLVPPVTTEYSDSSGASLSGYKYGIPELLDAGFSPVAPVGQMANNSTVILKFNFCVPVTATPKAEE